MSRTVKVKCHNLNCPNYFYLTHAEWEQHYRSGQRFPLLCKLCSEHRSGIVFPPSDQGSTVAESQASGRRSRRGRRA